MFTGLVQAIGVVDQISQQGPGVLLTIESTLLEGIAIGDSICISGCCLTAVSLDGTSASFEAGEETLAKTSLGKLAKGSQVNLERSLRPQDPMGGHFVTGHVDCVGNVAARDDDGEWCHMRFSVPSPFESQIAPKGSITIDGISLTVVDVVDREFGVALIPHTLEHTTLGGRAPGDEVNLETDILAKYVERALNYRPGS